VQGPTARQVAFSRHAARPMECSVGRAVRQASVASTFASDVERYDGKEVGASSEQLGDNCFCLICFRGACGDLSKMHLSRALLHFLSTPQLYRI